MLAELSKFIKKNFRQPNNGAVQIIIIHILVFIILIITKAISVLFGYESYYQAIYQYLILPASWKSFLHQPWSILTYFWIHEGFLSIIWNILFLHIFGQIILSIWHSRTLRILYILGGIIAGAVFLLLYNLVHGLRGCVVTLVGPAGGLYAMMVATALALPHFYLRLFFIEIINIRHFTVILLLLACFELGKHQPTAIAHLAGGLVGYIYVSLMNKFVKYSSILGYFLNISRRKKKFKVTYGDGKYADPIQRQKLGRQR